MRTSFYYQSMPEQGASQQMGMTASRLATRRAMSGSAFVAPGVLWVLVFTIFPLLYTLFMSLHSTTLSGSKFVGLRNFQQLFADYRFWSAVRVTLIFAAVSVTATVLLGVVLALAFNRGGRGARAFRTMSILPMFAAPIALGYLGLTIFYEQGGPVNNLLSAIGLAQVPWLSNGSWALVSVLAVDVWQWTPFVFLVVLAALQSVPLELYEVAELETSSGRKVLRWITLPLIRGPLGTVIILRIVEAFKVFDIPFTLTNGGPGIATRSLTYNVYVVALRNQNFGYSASMAVILLALVLVVAMVFFRFYGNMYDEERR